MDTQNLYPIKAVVIKSGLTAHVIRAWEKRYKAVVPKRTDTKRRMYSSDDVKKLILLKKATDAGHNIGNIANKDIADLEQLLQEKSIRFGYVPKPIAEAEYYLNECMNAIRAFDSYLFEKVLLKASMQLTQPVFIDFVILPLLSQIGSLWRAGDIRIMHEHMASAVLKPFLANLKNSYRPTSNAPSLIVTTPLGQIHELGALVISIIAASEGWNVVYLGPDLPAEEITEAAKEKNASFVVLSIVYPADDPYLKIEFEKLRKLLPDNIAIIAGGRLAENYRKVLTQIGAHLMDDTNQFRNLLSGPD